MDRENLRLISIIMAYICLCAILFGLPFICMEVKANAWKPKVMSGSRAIASAIVLLVSVIKVIGHQLVIDLQGAGSIDFMDRIYVARAE